MTRYLQQKVLPVISLGSAWLLTKDFKMITFLRLVLFSQISGHEEDTETH